MEETYGSNGHCTTSGLNLRATPGGTGITLLQQDATVEILEDQGDFVEANANGEVGFVTSKFIQQTGGAPSGGDAMAGSNFHFEGNNAVAPDGTVFGKKFKLGIFNNGTTSIADFVGANQIAFGNLSPSRQRVMAAVSANEGKLEAINTFDNAFLTFGCFQWTAGADNGAGELPAMVNLLKQKDANVFNQVLGQFGIDIASVNSPPGQPPTGFFSLNGTPVKSAADKQSKLRTLEMAFRFFQAGHDNTMRQVEVEYAASRIDLFYRDANHKILNRFIADFVNSEFGVALILDEHVNRPGHIPGTLATAVHQFITSTGNNDPTTWTDQDEASLLNIYIQHRNNTSMTDSNNRANRIRQAVADGLTSDERGSFQS